MDNYTTSSDLYLSSNSITYDGSQSFKGDYSESENYVC